MSSFMILIKLSVEMQKKQEQDEVILLLKEGEGIYMKNDLPKFLHSISRLETLDKKKYHV